MLSSTQCIILQRKINNTTKKGYVFEIFTLPDQFLFNIILLGLQNVQTVYGFLLLLQFETIFLSVKQMYT